jgi:hypothetical protein
MGFSNGFKTLVNKFSWVKSLTSGLDNEERVIRNRIMPELRELVSKFDTDIPVDYEKIEDGESTRFTIGPVEGVYFTRESDGDSIPTSALFNWLNDGTDVRRVIFFPPGEYKRESEPNSLSTSSQDNSGVTIYASKNFDFPGIEARNWTRLLRDKYQSEIERSFLTGIKQYLRGK